MIPSKFSLAFLSFMALTLAHLTMAQNSPLDFVDAHNQARAELGIGPVTWNETVAQYAQNYAYLRSGDCQLQHSQGSGFGENLAKGSGDFTGLQAVTLWVDEKPNYDYNTNSCVGGECLHYTQVIWQNTEHIGCARVQCNDEWWFVTCNYYPPGNYIGQTPY